MDEEIADEEIVDLIQTLEKRNLEVVGIVAGELTGFSERKFTGQAIFVLNYENGICGEVESYTKEDESVPRKAG